MKATLLSFSLTPFRKLKKNLLSVFVLLFFLCGQSLSLFAQNPSISCPADIVQNNDAGSCSASVSFPADNDESNNPGYTVSYNYNSGAPFPVGTTRVIKQLLDQNGVAVATCTFNVTVVDTEAPQITNCPGNLAVNNTTGVCGATVSFATPGVNESCTFQRKTYYFTGSTTTFVVPAGVTSIDVDIAGASGGRTFYNNSVYGNPGLGGETQATIAVTPGQVLTINVGGQGQDASSAAAGAGGYNGGGNGTGYTENNAIVYAAGGGGGATDIRTAGGTLADRIIVAGGGGGASTFDGGGNGGDLTGGDGSGGASPASGGTQATGGNGGSFDYTSSGGNGGVGVGGNGDSVLYGAGGGSGLYGGGGGSIGSGAGGSSYAYPGATNVYHIQGSQAGNGFVTLAYDQPATLVQTAGLASGSTFPIGETINTFTATDAAGNTSTCTFKVTVSDNEKPVVTAPANVAVFANANTCAATNVTLGTPVTSDNCGIASVTNNAPASFPVGTTTVTYTATDTHGNTSTATQTVTVTDNQKPVLTVPANQTFATAASSYTIPALVATDNCGISTITYSITGATVRSGTGANASGSFNSGTSVITYTVTDIHGNVQTGTTTVNVTATAPAITVTIPDAYAVSPGGNPNTIYIGYGNSYLVLNAVVTGGKAPYIYTWTKTGSPYPVSWFSSAFVFLPGEYTVTVTDLKGATGTYKKQVYVVDVRCGNNNDKVIVCKAAKGNKKSSTDCVNQDKVDDLLQKGGHLGECTQSNSSLKTGEVEITSVDVTETEKIAVPETAGVLVNASTRFSVYPNPASGYFTVRLNNYKAAKAEVILLSQNGMTVQRKTVTLKGANESITFNTGNLTSGIYLVKVVSEEGIQTAKVLLQR